MEIEMETEYVHWDPKVCPFCDKQLKSEKQVRRHINSVHSQPHKAHDKAQVYFECEACHLKYKREEGLKQHYARVHSSIEAKFVCFHCDKRYKLKMDLILHISRTHMCDTRVCRFCGKSVKDIKGHEWRHQVQERSKDYPCGLCYKKFRSQTSLDNHVLRHREMYTCGECGLEFSGPTQLRNHKLRHKPGTPCTICGKEFFSRSNFYQHVLTHQNVRPYKCDVCNEDFTQRSSLLRHRKIHPGPLPPLTAPTAIAELAKNILSKF